jgi:ADP-ribose pyrophosphatase
MTDEQPRPWRRIATRLIWQSQWYDLRQDVVRIHTGATITYTYQDHPGAVMVVPVTPDGRVVMLRQYRYLLAAWSWEAPAGGVHPGETASAAAARELAEETGYAASALVPLGGYYPSKSVSNERLDLFLATGVTPLPAVPAHEPTELLRVHLRPLAEAVAMVHGGEITDAQTALALLLAAHRLGSAATGG